MKLLKEIFNADINEVDQKPEGKFRERLAARAVLIDEDGRAAIIEAKNIKIHKILGGGIEKGENIELALEREILEESGCKGDVTHEVGMVIEHRSNINLKQTNYCFIANLVGKKGQPEFTKKEQAEGFELVWISIDEALKRFAMDQPIEYSAKFQQHRDNFFLNEAAKILKQRQK